MFPVNERKVFRRELLPASRKAGERSVDDHDKDEKDNADHSRADLYLHRIEHFVASHSVSTSLNEPSQPNLTTRPKNSPPPDPFPPARAAKPAPPLPPPPPTPPPRRSPPAHKRAPAPRPPAPPPPAPPTSP